MEPSATVPDEAAAESRGGSLGSLRRDPRYRRLGVRGRTAAGRSSYWLGEDHLLVVQTEHFAESYKRFFFRDIQAVLIRRTRAWEWGMALGLGAVGLLALVALLQVNQLSESPGGGPMAVMMTFGLLALSLLAAVMVHGVMGPSCVVSIHTGVQSRQLSGVSRWRQAERVVAMLEPEIQAAQQSTPATAESAGAEQPVDPEKQLPEQGATAS